MLDSVRAHRKEVVGEVKLIHFDVKEGICQELILNYIGKVSIDTLTDERLPIDIQKHLKLERISYPNNCYSLDISENALVKEKGLKGVVIEMPLQNWSLEVLVQGKELNTWRQISYNSFFSSGDSINPNPGAWNIYSIRIKQNRFLEDDPAQNCRNYPNSDFQSYKECDDKLSKNHLANKFPGVVPVWITDDLDNVSTNVRFEKGHD